VFYWITYLFFIANIINASMYQIIIYRSYQAM